MWGRKGQVSLFIVVGLGLLLVFGILIIAFQPSVRDDELTQHLSSSEEMLPISLLIQQCAHDLGVQALQRAGASGGYVFPQTLSINSFSATEGDGFYFGVEAPVSYWYYLSSPNTCDSCAFSSNRRDLIGLQNSVQRDVQEYIDERMESCLGGFSSLIDQGYVVDARFSQLATEVTFTKQDVLLEIDLPIYAEVANKQVEERSFSSRIDVPFRQLYDTATLLTAAAVRFHFLERYVVSIISAYSGLEQDRLPPMSDSSFAFSAPVIWSEQTVKEDVEQLLGTYVPGLQVTGASNYQEKLAPEDLSEHSQLVVEALLRNMELPITLEEPFDVTFEYPYTGYYFATNDVGIIQPSGVGIDWLPFFGIQRYNTQYDISYPVLVTVHDERALGGNGFSLSFGLEGNLRNNEPLADPQDAEVLFAPEETLFCNPQFYTSLPVNITVRDGYTSTPYGDVSIMYSCGSESCAIGQTESDGTYSGSFPVCLGGEIALLHQDTGTTTVEVSASVDNGVALDAELYPFEDVTVSLDIDRLVKSSPQWVGSAAEGLSFDEYAVLTLTERIGNHVVATTFNATTEEQIIQLAPGIYDASVSVYFQNEDDPYVINPQRREAGGGTFSSPEVYYVPAEVTYFDTLQLGGAILDPSTTSIRVTSEDIQSGKTLVIPTVVYDMLGITIDRRILEDISVPAEWQDYYRQRGYQSRWE